MTLKANDIGPARNLYIERQLKQIDPGLTLRFYRFWPDLKGKPLLSRPPSNSNEVDLTNRSLEPIYYPRWYLFLENDNGRAYLIRVIENADKTFRPLDNRVVRETLADKIRVLGIKEYNRRVQEEVNSRKSKALEKASERNKVWFSENKSKVSDVLANPAERVKTHRDSKIFSYGGQRSRHSKKDNIKLTSTELGYKEVPLEE